jgi:hypothetical protein
MRKKLQQQATRITTLVKKVRRDSIQIFKETPSDEQILSSDSKFKKESAYHPTASDLFSMFTADIIKQDVTFTR